jgi:hypothetical protein
VDTDEVVGHLVFIACLQHQKLEWRRFLVVEHDGQLIPHLHPHALLCLLQLPQRIISNGILLFWAGRVSKLGDEHVAREGNEGDVAGAVEVVLQKLGRPYLSDDAVDAEACVVLVVGYHAAVLVLGALLMVEEHEVGIAAQSHVHRNDFSEAVAHIAGVGVDDFEAEGAEGHVDLQVDVQVLGIPRQHQGPDGAVGRVVGYYFLIGIAGGVRGGDDGIETVAAGDDLAPDRLRRTAAVLHEAQLAVLQHQHPFLHHLEVLQGVVELVVIHMLDDPLLHRQSIQPGSDVVVEEAQHELVVLEGLPLQFVIVAIAEVEGQAVNVLCPDGGGVGEEEGVVAEQQVVFVDHEVTGAEGGAPHCDFAHDVEVDVEDEDMGAVHRQKLLPHVVILETHLQHVLQQSFLLLLAILDAEVRQKDELLIVVIVEFEAEDGAKVVAFLEGHQAAVALVRSCLHFDLLVQTDLLDEVLHFDVHLLVGIFLLVPQQLAVL